MAKSNAGNKELRFQGDKTPCPKCRKPLGVAARKCHHCGKEFTEAETKARVDSNLKFSLGCVSVLLPLFAIGYCAIQPSAEERAATQEAELKKREEGMHCVSAWDVSNLEVKERTKALLRDPSSFEHVETRISDVNGGGEHRLMMRYRARNGFGGMTPGQAWATIRSADCSIVDFNLGDS